MLDSVHLSGSDCKHTKTFTAVVKKKDAKKIIMAALIQNFGMRM